MNMWESLMDYLFGRHLEIIKKKPTISSWFLYQLQVASRWCKIPRFAYDKNPWGLGTLDPMIFPYEWAVPVTIRVFICILRKMEQMIIILYRWWQLKPFFGLFTPEIPWGFMSPIWRTRIFFKMGGFNHQHSAMISGILTLYIGYDVICISIYKYVYTYLLQMSVNVLLPQVCELFHLAKKTASTAKSPCVLLRLDTFSSPLFLGGF